MYRTFEKRGLSARALSSLSRSSSSVSLSRGLRARCEGRMPSSFACLLSSWPEAVTAAVTEAVTPSSSACLRSNCPNSSSTRFQSRLAPGAGSAGSAGGGGGGGEAGGDGDAGTPITLETHSDCLGPAACCAVPAASCASRFCSC